MALARHSTPKLVMTDQLPDGYLLAIFGRALDDETASVHTRRLYMGAAERFLGFMDLRPEQPHAHRRDHEGARSRN